jgi:hypothetical protein
MFCANVTSPFAVCIVLEPIEGSTERVNKKILEKKIEGHVKLVTFIKLKQHLVGKNDVIGACLFLE